jgi:antitoxin CcdA
MIRPRLSARRPTNVSLDADLVAEAKALGINLSHACEAGLIAELKAAREAAWLRENAAAIESSNRWLTQNGLPLGQYRRF